MMPFRFRREAHVLLAVVLLAPTAGFAFALLVPWLARGAGHEEAAAAEARTPEGWASHLEDRPSRPEEPSLGTVVGRLVRYVAEYGDRLSVVVGVERYDQQIVETKATRTLVSEIALVPAGGDWVSYRDVFEVDGRRVADRTDRLQRLLLDSPATAFEQARRIANESARFNLGGIQRNFNTPTMCLFSLREENRSRFKFAKTKDGPAGAQADWKIRFEEKDRPTIVRSPDGRSLPMAGFVWVRPDTGEVSRTDLEIGREVRASVTVEYERDAKLGMMLPARMHEVYRGAHAPGGGDGGSTVEGDARYSDFKRFTTSARIVVPKSQGTSR